MHSTKRTWLALAVAGAVLLAPSTTALAASPATIKVAPTTFVPSEQVKISVDYPTSSPYLGLEILQDNAWVDVAGQQHKKASSSGTYTFSYRPLGTETVRVISEAGLATDNLELKPLATSGVLNAIVDDPDHRGTEASATATFTPARSGQVTELQALTIKTETTPEMPAAKWQTIAKSTQNASGKTTFTIDDPLEVSHSYRAITGPSGGSIKTISNQVTYAAPAVTKNTGLSTVYFNSNEGDSVNTRSRYFEGEFSMTASDLLPECKAVGNQKKANLKGRGNYSWSFGKKSFTLKLDKKQNLCGMGESKKWALVANAYDKSLLRNSTAMHIGSKMTNLAWTPKSKPVDFYVNGSYRGSYILIERITVAENRVNIAELKDNQTGANDVEPNITGGYILEWDYRKGADRNVTAGSRGWVGIKEPENESDGSGITDKQVSYVNSYLDATDKALFGSDFKSNTNGWQKYIDIDSAVDYYIAQELTKPVDGNMWASVYMYKPRSGKLEFGPMWDYDLALGSANRGGNTVSPQGWYLRNPVNISAKQSEKTWFNRLNEDSEFRAAVAKRWKVVEPGLRTTDNFIDDQKVLINKSATENFKKWNVNESVSTAQVQKGSWSNHVSYLRSWVNSRINWMDGQY